MMAVSGMTHLWNHAETEQPVGSQTSYPDYLVGVYAAYAIVAALLERDGTGEGREIDLSQLAVAAGSLGPAVVAAANGLDEVVPLGNRSAQAAPHGCYPCHGGNDAWCVISVGSDQQWRALRELMGDPDWARHAAYDTAPGRIAHADAIDEQVAAWTRGQSPREVFESCQGRGVPAGMVATGEDLRSDPQLAARGFVMEHEHPRMGRLRVPGPPIRLGSGGLPVWRLGPLLGEDNEAVLGGILGLSAEDIERLTTAEVIK
jgi:benzylsuccinate CoA-transferase BbsF subunit